MWMRGSEDVQGVQSGGAAVSTRFLLRGLHSVFWTLLDGELMPPGLPWLRATPTPAPAVDSLSLPCHPSLPRDLASSSFLPSPTD